MNEHIKIPEGTPFNAIGHPVRRKEDARLLTGQTQWTDNMTVPGTLHMAILRSPVAHARITKLDLSAALALPGVKAIVTAKDFPEQANLIVPTGEMQVNLKDITRNIMAREKALYEGHPVAAVAAISEAVAKQALALIKVDYKVLPHVIDVADAMKPGAPILHEGMMTEGANPPATKPSNIAKRIEFKKGDAAAGFAQAEIVIERDYSTQAVHQGYIEPQGVVANYAEDGQAMVWCSSQGQFLIRDLCINMLGMVNECRVPLLMLVTIRGTWTEFNPWQMPMSEATATVLGAMGCVVKRVDKAEEVGPIVSAACQLAFNTNRPVAVLMDQRLVGTKEFK